MWTLSFPATTGPEDLQISCDSIPFPVLRTDRACFSSCDHLNQTDGLHIIAGQATEIPDCPDGETECDS